MDDAIVGVGGFLGLGEHDVAVPLERLSWPNDRAMLPRYTEEELENLPEYNFREVSTLPRNRTIEYSVNRR